MPEEQKAKRLADYKALANSKQLEIQDDEIPGSNRETFKWFCPDCKKYRLISFSALKRKENGCSKCFKKRSMQKTVEIIFLEHGIKIGKNLPKTTRDSVEWYCKNSHPFKTSISNIRANRACLKCGREKNSSINQRRIIKAVDKIFRDYKICIGNKMPITTKDSVEWSCNKKHFFKTSISNIRAGKFCLKCGREKTAAQQRHKESDYRKLSIEAKCKWLGPLPSNVFTPTYWACAICNRKFRKCFNALQSSGIGRCLSCSRNATFESLRTVDLKYHSAAKQWGWIWIGPAVSNQHELTGWRCLKTGHGKFYGRLQHVKLGSGCQKCGYDRTSEFKRASSEKYSALAKKCRCNWISESLPRNSLIYTTFECWGENKENRKHKFRYSYNRLLSNRDLAITLKRSVCPKCAKIDRESMPESVIYHLLKKLGRRLRQVKFRKWWIDIVLFCNGFKIAIEYDGWHYHKNRLEKDRIKRKALREAGYLTLRIKGGKSVPTREQLVTAIAKLTAPKYNRAWIEITLPDWLEPSGN